MRTMAYTKLSLLVAFYFVAQSLQYDPVVDFCRRWAHQTAVIDGRLYIDGGEVAYKNLEHNYTNDFLLYNDLKIRSDVGFPKQYSNLSKPAGVPSLSGGYLWADEVNKCFYQFGGAVQEGASPQDFSMWTYDVILNQWNTTNFKSSERIWQRPAFGSGTQVESLGLGFYYGGWLSNRTTPSWKGPRMAVSSIVKFDYTTGVLQNTTHDGIGRAEGQLVFLPVSDRGMLLYFGGIEDPYHNGSYNAANMTKIHLYDIDSGKWYSQTATGDVPLSRRQFCAGVTWPDDRSSFNIYIYGGYGFGNPAAFDDVYILSLPSFKWIRAYSPGGSDPYQFGHGGCSASVMTPDQMMIIGGWFPNPAFSDCDEINKQGQHNMVLGMNSGKQDNAIWDKYDPKLSQYVVPTVIISAIGGGPTGGATVTAPTTWETNDVKVYFNISSSFPTRAATRAFPPTTTPVSSSSAKKSNIGAIAGGTVGGLAVLIAVLCLILFCLHRRKKAKKNRAPSTPAAPPAELAVTQYPHEMSSPGASKYVSAHERSVPNELPVYSGLAAVQTRTTSHDHAALYDPEPLHVYESTQSHPAGSYSSPQNVRYDQSSQSPLRSPNNTELFFPQEHDTYNAQQGSWNQQASPPQQAPVRQRQYSYPTPTSPQQPASDLAQQQSQVYYPPPQDSAHPQHSRPSASDQGGSPTGTHYSDNTRHGNTPIISTMTTPAQFYAQPVPVRYSADNNDTRYSPVDERRTNTTSNHWNT